jgi:hypothetical protein
MDSDNTPDEETTDRKADCVHSWKEVFRTGRFRVEETCMRCGVLRQREDLPYVPDWAEPKVRVR